MKVQSLSREAVVCDPHQPRKTIDKGDLQSLADSISKTGQLQPVIVYSAGNRFMLADGHRRHAAISLLNRKTIEAIVLPEKPPQDQLLVIQMTANCQRSDLRPTELANAMQRLKDLKGWTNSEVSEHLSLAKSKVTQVLSYLSLPEDMQKALDDGNLAGSTAYAISRASDPETRRAMLKAALNGNLKRDDAARRVGKKKPPATRMIRATFRLSTGSVVLSRADSMSLEQCLELCRHLARECRKAAKQGIDLSTLQRVLNDQHGTQRPATS